MKTRCSVVAALLLGSAAAGGSAAGLRDVSAKDVAWGRGRAAEARQMIARLDVTSFPNSTGPRRRPGARTLAQYGFTRIESFDDGWAYAKKVDGSWQVGVFVLDDGPRRKRLCFTDTATNGGTYRGTTTLDVAATSEGLWRVIDLPGPVEGCS